ncbi:MAG: EFR1 family ferrodoxin [Dethiobacteria bacterium]|nr:EFR1 family ferrodoxin [Dethiobacteria bacterium]
MKLKIYYLTGTGNSLVIARNIGSYFNQCELFFIPNLMRSDRDISIAGDLVGFVFPVYFARPPVVVSEFIQRVRFEELPYLFAVINGGGLFGRSLNLFNEDLMQKNLMLNTGFIVSMPGNHPKIANIQRKSPEKLFEAEAIKTEVIAGQVKAGKTLKMESNWKLPGHILAQTLFQKPYLMSVAKMLDSAYWVSGDCNNCGTCQSICPVDNISYYQAKPLWHHNCVNCAACYHHCPTKAICLGKEDPSFRYRHPLVSTETLISQSAEI